MPASSKVISVVGWSGSGKTTLLEGVVTLLAEQGVRVNVVKHSHHDIELEPAHKDSARLRRAGAAEVMIASPYRIGVFRELRGAPEPALDELLTRLSPADLTLIEGYKWASIPKLEVFRPALGRPALYPDDPDVRAVASDVPRPADVAPALTWLPLSDRAAIARWLRENFFNQP